MSRAYNARRKAKRQAQAAAERARTGRISPHLRRLPVVVPIVLIVATFAAVGVLGFGADTGTSKEQVAQEVTELLEGIPQEGAVLGSPEAPLTVWVYADLECPTVRLFVEGYLPSIIDRWVRPGTVKLEYRSLQTDSGDEEAFFDQEKAALAAGRQGVMWNFALTFLRQQGEEKTAYVTEDFISGIASQVPGLRLAQWRNDRRDAALSEDVALDVQSGHRRDLDSTPALLYALSGGQTTAPPGVDPVAARKELASDLRRAMETLGDEAFGDVPTAGGL